MNRYGQQAMRHWQQTTPAEQVAQLENPQQHFTTLGEDVAVAVENLARELAGQAPPGEGYLQRLRRLTTAKFEAEAQVVREMVLTDPE